MKYQIFIKGFTLQNINKCLYAIFIHVSKFPFLRKWKWLIIQLYAKTNALALKLLAALFSRSNYLKKVISLECDETRIYEHSLLAQFEHAYFNKTGLQFINHFHFLFAHILKRNPSIVIFLCDKVIFIIEEAK